ncbi:MAG: hypothetical protein JNK14_19805 [Chitinophagaceae bacterium]|nr:hypothetical protein [Chitinophagaceae bacterium]
MKKVIHLLSADAISFSVITQNVGIGTASPLEKPSADSASGYGISHEYSLIKLSTYS